MLRSVLLLLLPIQSTAFTHDWDTVQELMFGWVGDGSDDTPLPQLEWMADHYGLGVVSNAAGLSNLSWPGQFEQARLLKARNPAIKTPLYAQSEWYSCGCDSDYDKNLIPLMTKN